MACIRTKLQVVKNDKLTILGQTDVWLDPVYALTRRDGIGSGCVLWHVERRAAMCNNGDIWARGVNESPAQDLAAFRSAWVSEAWLLPLEETVRFRRNDRCRRQRKGDSDKKGGEQERGVHLGKIVSKRQKRESLKPGELPRKIQVVVLTDTSQAEAIDNSTK